MSKTMQRQAHETEWHPTPEQLLESALGVVKSRRVETHADACKLCMQTREVYVTFAKVYAADNLEKLTELVSDIEEEEEGGIRTVTSGVVSGDRKKGRPQSGTPPGPIGPGSPVTQNELSKRPGTRSTLP